MSTLSTIWCAHSPIVQAVLLAVVISGTASPSLAIELNGEVDGRLVCPDLGNTYECAQRLEKEFLLANPSLATRRDGILNVRLENGSYFQIRDEDATYNVMELQAGGRFLAIHKQFHEGSTWHLLDRENGAMTEIYGYPLFSSDESKFIAVSTDLLAQFSPTVFSVYVVLPKGVAEVFAGIAACSTWGAMHVRWRDNHSAEFAVATIETELTDAEKPSPVHAVLDDRDGVWRITPPINLGCQ